MAFSAPAPNFNDLQLRVEPIPASMLIRISKHDTGEPFFGKTGGNRFDDPRRHLPASKRFGACYFGGTFDCAIGETLLHDAILDPDGNFTLPKDSFERYVIRFKDSAKPLAIANITGPFLRRLGGDNMISAAMDYALTQAWSLAIYNHPAKVDGFRYVSRHINTDMAIVLFDRTKRRLHLESATPYFPCQKPARRLWHWASGEAPKLPRPDSAREMPTDI
jgi:hypothetical protein